MPASTRFQRSGRRLVERFGQAGNITLKRTHSVRDKDDRLPLSTLELSGDHSEDDTALTLKAPDDGPVEGTIPKGLVLTIDSVEYTVAAEVSEASNQFAVTITTGLTSDQSADATVTLAGSVTYTLTGAYSDADVARLPPVLADSVTHRIKIAAAGSPVTPKNGDLVTGKPFEHAASRTDLVHRCNPRPGGWDLLAGAA